MAEIPVNDRRQNIRVRYAPDECPEINIAGTIYSVSDISENGLIFYSNDLGFRMRQPLFGFVTFANGTVVAVEGEVLRMKIDRVIVRLSRGVSSERIMEENERQQRTHGHTER